MREIKFRGIRRDGKGFAYGNLEKFENIKGVIGYNIGYGHSNYRVKEETIGEYIGLKDKNGKDIYEGDIWRETIEYDFGDEFLYHVCVWIPEWTMFTWLSYGEYLNWQDNGIKSLNSDYYPRNDNDEVVVCGNIYENPETLNN